MSRDVHDAAGVIGPNAILQMVPVLDRFGGPEWRAQILALAGLSELPDGSRMIPERDAARLHRQLRVEAPAFAPILSAQAGVATANYILQHRIPSLAQSLLKALPSGAAARLLSRAISKHAWTFVGSGRLRVVDTWTFEIENNPLIRGETSDTCLCDWHAAVFQHLYRILVTPNCVCTETHCAAQALGKGCRFELHTS